VEKLIKKLMFKARRWQYSTLGNPLAQKGGGLLARAKLRARAKPRVSRYLRESHPEKKKFLGCPN